MPPDVLTRANILGRSIDKRIVPCVAFLRGVLGSDANIGTAVSLKPYLLAYNHEITMRPAVETLRLHGLSEEAISKLLDIRSGVLTMTPSRIGEIFKDREALGLPITDSGFANVFWVMSELKRENWLRKVELYDSFGVSKSELFQAIKKQPTIMKLSSETIKKQLRFFLDELKLELSDVMGQPVLIGFRLEKSILPRCTVLSVLMREGKIEREIALHRTLCGSSKAFSDKYVLWYADNVPDVVKAYEGKIKFKGFRDQDV